MKEGMEFTGENSIDTDVFGESFSGAIAEHFRETAERDFPDDILPLEEAFFAERGINRDDIVPE